MRFQGFDDCVEADVVEQLVDRLRRSKMPDIKPRIDEAGVPWCDAGCPYYDESDQPEFDNPAEIDLCAKGVAQSPCPVATARFAAENAEMRDVINGIETYALDCLSGPEKGRLTVPWLLGGYGEIVRRIRALLAKDGE